MSSQSFKYGAEYFARIYPRSLGISFLVSSLLIVGLILYPFIVNRFKEKRKTQIPVKVKTTINYSQLQAPPPIDLERKPPELMQAVPVVKTKKYLPPVPKKDEEVLEELPTIEELSSVMIGTEDIEGLDSIIVDHAEAEVISEPVEAPAEIFTYAEIMPEFVGGMESFRAYLKDNLKYPPLARENNIEGRVFISFVVETDGSVSSAQVVRSVHPSLDAEALRVIEDMPAWNPGMQNQIPVRVSFTIPVVFKLRK